MDISCHDVVPIPITSTNVGAHTTTNSNTKDHHNHQQNDNKCISKTNNAGIKKGALLVKYKECLKNHAASIGGNATDGCGEFMPNGEEGTLEALKCSACNCHRNFHRKETQGNEYEPYVHNHKGLQLVPTMSPHMHMNMSMIMPLGAMQPSDHSDEIEGVKARPLMVKKRFRTKFTAEQKEKMLRFAEKVGWKLQRQEENVVQQLCQEIGIRRRVLKVWMHNNKHILAKKGSLKLD